VLHFNSYNCCRRLSRYLSTQRSGRTRAVWKYGRPHQRSAAMGAPLSHAGELGRSGVHKSWRVYEAFSPMMTLHDIPDHEGVLPTFCLSVSATAPVAGQLK